MSDFETVPRGTLEKLEAVKAERDALDARMTEMGRIIRASVREEFKSATSPVGAAQGEIAALEAERDALEEKLAESDHALMQLGRLKAKWQAEALDKEVGNFTRDAGDADSCTEKLIYKRVARCLRESSANLRRQAEAEQ